MACFRSHHDEAGYATPAAMLVSLALALVATATLERCVSALMLARADLERMQAEYLLAGAHLQAVATVVRTSQTPPYHWTFVTDGAFVEVRAEPEREKLGLEAASLLPDDVLAQFGVADPAALRVRLTEAAHDGGVEDIGSLDPSALWSACAPALISAQGTGQVIAALAWASPVDPGPRPQSWRIGETWRLEATTSAGWRDERIVRFTGDARRPAATVLRRLSRKHGGRGQCERIWEAVAPA